MKRMHIHVAVAELDANVRFYSNLFGTAPTVLKPDYAKWMLDDPRVNFAISQRGRASGLDHLGVQADSEDELHQLTDRLKEAELSLYAEGKTSCCYAKSDKAWLADPQGIAWETFYTFGDATTYGVSAAHDGPVDQTEPGLCGDSAGCCAPKSTTTTDAPDKAAACC